MKKTPVRIFVAPRSREVAEARIMNIPMPKAQPMADQPFRMVSGAPGTDTAKREARKRLSEAGFMIRSVNHTPEGDLLAYVAHEDDVSNPLPPPRKPGPPVPRKVR